MIFIGKLTKQTLTLDR